MTRATTVLTILLCAAACRRGPQLEGQPSAGSRTASPYSSGTDSGSSNQRIEGTSTGKSFEAPAQIPGVVTALQQVTGAGKAPDQSAVTALRGNLGRLQDAMRNDFTRVGLADTGAFRALRDSIAGQLGGGGGGLAKAMDAKGARLLSSRVQRLIQTYNDWMQTARS
jgi:hypothetical protein